MAVVVPAVEERPEHHAREHAAHCAANSAAVARVVVIPVRIALAEVHDPVLRPVGRGNRGLVVIVLGVGRLRGVALGDVLPGGCEKGSRLLVGVAAVPFDFLHAVDRLLGDASVALARFLFALPDLVGVAHVDERCVERILGRGQLGQRLDRVDVAVRMGGDCLLGVGLLRGDDGVAGAEAFRVDDVGGYGRQSGMHLLEGVVERAVRLLDLFGLRRRMAQRLLGHARESDGLVALSFGGAVAARGDRAAGARDESRDLVWICSQRCERGLRVRQGEVVDFGHEDVALPVKLVGPRLKLGQVLVDPRREVSQVLEALLLRRDRFAGRSGQREYPLIHLPLLLRGFGNVVVKLLAHDEGLLHGILGGGQSLGELLGGLDAEFSAGEFEFRGRPAHAVVGFEELAGGALRQRSEVFRVLGLELFAFLAPAPNVDAAGGAGSDGRNSDEERRGAPRDSRPFRFAGPLRIGLLLLQGVLFEVGDDGLRSARPVAAAPFVVHARAVEGLPELGNGIA